MKSSMAVVFPGQGSQSVGMLSELAHAFPSVLQTFEQVSERLGYDLWALVQQGPEQQLNQTQQTQVAMLTADVAVYDILMQQIGIRPRQMAGHSLGEYAALVCAGAINLADAAELVTHRGRLMQEDVPLGVGAMAAVVGLPDEKVILLCREASKETETVAPANFNAIGQVVIAGHTAAVNRAIELAEELGARMARLIPVSVPCHCRLLTQTAERFEAYLQRAPFCAPQLPVVSNVDLSIYESPEQIRHLLKEQLYRPVRWVETIQQMKSVGIHTVIECGPGRVLGGLVKRIDKTLKIFSIYDADSLSLFETQCYSKKENVC